MERNLDALADRLVLGIDSFLRTLARTHHAQRPSPAEQLSDSEPDVLTERERRHSAGLMRVNHAGEVCAQALYEGQSLTARDASVRRVLEDAASEEEDHLAWCAERLDELGSAPSVLDPLWFMASFSLGAAAGVLGDRVSLGFVAATEEQVCRHLERHLASLPPNDHRSRAVLQQMHADEARHGTQALAQGGAEFPTPVKAAMTLVSSVMTRSSYYV
jgi:3-demethoxyubiquinol 3-hydroxylase